ncbi:MAG: hypothetical protein JK586_00840 [Nocardiopsis sp. BM-2018]|nr:MAG: hypothetical protein JK586_00840 [Nocardiopsis sp. BM-2018]
MKLTSSVLSGSDQFRANRAAHLAALEEIAQAAAEAAEGGGKPARDRHRARRFWKSAPPRRMACMTVPPPVPGSSPGSGASTGRSAWSCAMTPP